MSDNDIRVVEEELRAAFARHEPLTPAAGPVRDAIRATAVRRRRRRRTTRAVGAALALLAVVSVPVLGRAMTGPAAPVGGVPMVPFTPAVPAEPLNFLVLGVDGGNGRENGHRADSIMIVHVPRDRSRLYLVSLPRDLGVEVTGRGFGKLGESFYHGSYRPGAKPDLRAGAALTERTVAALTGLRFDATATLTYAGLRRVTDAVGGVRVCLPRPVRSSHTERHFPAGCQQLDGAAALDLLRQRYSLPTGAHDRDRNGQRFAEALLQKVARPATAGNPLQVAAIVRAAGHDLSLDLRGMALTELFGSLRRVAAADAVGIGWTYHPEPGADVRFESLDPAESRSLFDAARRDAMADWTAAHPDRVTR